MCCLNLGCGTRSFFLPMMLLSLAVYSPLLMWTLAPVRQPLIVDAEMLVSSPRSRVTCH